MPENTIDYRELLETVDGRRELVRIRARLVGDYAATIVAVDPENPETWPRIGEALEPLAAFDSELHAATGVTSSSGKVRHRGTREVGELVSGFERDVTGFPHVRARFDDGITTDVILVDLERVEEEDTDGDH